MCRKRLQSVHRVREMCIWSAMRVCLMGHMLFQTIKPQRPVRAGGLLVRRGAGMMVCRPILGIRRPYASYPDVGSDDK